MDDTTDVTRFSILPNVTPAALPKNSYTSVLIGDIVAVNGQPAKGTIQTQGNNAIVSGTGAFLGMHGLKGQAALPNAIPVRQASIAEDPANRRKNGEAAADSC